MKKIITMMVCLMASSSFVCANALGKNNASLDNNNDSIKQSSIWAHSKKSLTIGWVDQDFASETSSVSHSKFGVMLRRDRTFLFPAKPIAGLIKFGIDFNIADLTVAKYDTDSAIKSDGWITGGQSLDMGDDDINIPNIGMWTINYGIGIGPSVSIAPFSSLSGVGRYLKARVYFHYKPSFSILVVSEDGDYDAEYAFANMFDFGGKLMFRRISIGAEGQWGNGKFKTVSFFNDEEDAIKTKYKFAAMRFYISYNF